MLIAIPKVSNAEQISFKKTSSADNTQFDYQWIDAQDKAQSLSFTLSTVTLNDLPTIQANYQPQIVQRHITVALQKEAGTIDPREAIVNILPQNEQVNIKVKSSSNKIADQVLSQLQHVKQAAYNEYLTTHYFTEFTTLFNQRGIKPDHTRYIKDSTKPLIPISQAFYDQVEFTANANARAFLNLLLGWAQSIPYNAMEDRMASNGSGFAPPLGLIIQNAGDCDSKAVLVSALIKAGLPTTNIVMVLLPHHALLGIALTPADGEETLLIDGEKYILFDPTGPALLPFGQISDDTRRYIATGRYQIEHIN